MNKIVITGASGFLGTNLLKKLEKNKDVRIYALSSRNIQLVSDNIFSFHKDVIDTKDAEDILSDAVVVNCAFPRNSAGTDMADGLSYISRLFFQCKKYKAKAIINISSQSVYSQKRELPADENTEICLESSYAVGKYATELLLDSIFADTEINYTNLRMASLIGPGFDQRIVNRLVKKALDLEPITVSVSKQTFGFLDICDAVDAISSLLAISHIRWSHIYTVGNNRAVSLQEIIENIKNVFTERGMKLPIIEYLDEEKMGTTAVSYEKLHKETGFVPCVSLKESTQQILDYMK